jgi:hypothetical protein
MTVFGLGAKDNEGYAVHCGFLHLPLPGPFLQLSPFYVWLNNLPFPAGSDHQIVLF